MAKSFYFSHDYSSRNDPKLIKLRKDMGLEGLGLYWCIIEMLYEQNGKLLIEDMESIAFTFGINVESINNLIENYGLFRKNKKYFYSDSVNIRLQKREEKSKKAKDSAMTRWNSDANALQTQSERNAIKEKKGKEIKESKLNKTLQEENSEDPLSKVSVQNINLTEHEYGQLKALVLGCGAKNNEQAESYIISKIEQLRLQKKNGLVIEKSDYLYIRGTIQNEYRQNKSRIIFVDKNKASPKKDDAYDIYLKSLSGGNNVSNS